MAFVSGFTFSIYRRRFSALIHFRTYALNRNAPDGQKGQVLMAGFCCHF